LLSYSFLLEREGPTTREGFEAYLKRVLAPSLKVLLRRAGARTRYALIEAMGRALDAVTASDARGFFEHRGYRATAHLL
jgi:hypothetical protein